MAFKMRGFSPFTQKKKSKGTPRLAVAKKKKCPICKEVFLIHDDGKGNWLTAEYDKHVASHTDEVKEGAKKKKVIDKKEPDDE